MEMFEPRSHLTIKNKKIKNNNKKQQTANIILQQCVDPYI